MTEDNEEFSATTDTMPNEGASSPGGFSASPDASMSLGDGGGMGMDAPIGAGIGFPDDGFGGGSGANPIAMGTVDLLDVPLDVSVELGRARMPIQDVVNITAGAVIELDKVAGEPLDVLLNGRLVARGEAVVVGERFGVRITSIVSPRERLARLN